MREAKPILWVRHDTTIPQQHQDKIREQMPDYYIVFSIHDSIKFDMQVLNGEALTDEKYNALMEALKK